MDDDRPQRDELHALLGRVPSGWSRVVYNGHPYGLTRNDHAAGRSCSIWAEQLDGTDVISANLWQTADGLQLRPCEMPAAKVLDFLERWSAADHGGRIRSKRASGPISK